MAEDDAERFADVSKLLTRTGPLAIENTYGGLVGQPFNPETIEEVVRLLRVHWKQRQQTTGSPPVIPISSTGISSTGISSTGTGTGTGVQFRFQDEVNSLR